MVRPFRRIVSLALDQFHRHLAPRLVRLLEDNRGLVILLFCLPASFIFDLFVRLRIWAERKFERILGNGDHVSRVAKVREQVLAWRLDTTLPRKKMCTARKNWLSLSTSFFDKRQCQQIDLDLHEVLHVDEKNMIVWVEPNVTVAEICAHLNPLGYALAVTLEIGDATLGGLAFGVGMTTYSHRVGLYQETILEYELVTANGDAIVVREDNEHADLFRALPWSHGSLGFLVSLRLKIIPVKQFVRIQYETIRGQDEFCAKLMQLSGANDAETKTPDFLEATVFGGNTAVIMSADFVDVRTKDDRRKVNDIALWWKPWFYKHVESFIEKGGGEEIVPLTSYLLRHNRALFWVLESMIPFGNHPLFRLLFGWLCPPKPAFLKFTTTPTIREWTFVKQVFQDIVMPLDTLKDQINKAIELFDVDPLLVYPCRIYSHRNGAPQGQLRSPPTKRLVPGTNYALFNDLGVYGTPSAVRLRKQYNATRAMREMEKFTRDVGGYSFLYADVFMTESEFREMFDLQLYEQVRRQYNADEGFPHLWEKIRPEVDVIAIGERYARQDRQKDD